MYTKKYLHIPIHIRIFLMATGILSLFFTVIFLYQYKSESQLRKEVLHEKLQGYNFIIGHAVMDNDISVPTVDSVINDISKEAHLRVTIIDSDGTVVFDNIKDSQTFDNHAGRPEVINANKDGAGYSLRYSKSLSSPYFYSAKKVGDYTIRTALPFDQTINSYLQVGSGYIVFFFAISIASILILLLFCIRLGRTIKSLRTFALKAEREELDTIDFKFPVQDIGVIANHIIKLYSHLSNTKKDLMIEKEKLTKHLHISKEGLSVFSKDHSAIFTNTLFIQYINIISDTEVAKPEDIFDIPEFKRIKYFIRLNSRKNNISANEYLRESININKNGKSFCIECIMFQDKSYEVTINNITQLEEETRLKRQLTQNVSHELKTPVTSIKGYLETILENPELDPKMITQFIVRCQAQANRLSDLLQDLSVLNRIDEVGDQFQSEEINIADMVADIVDESSLVLAEKNMQAFTDIPSNTIVTGNQLLMYSIFRNLLDNAIAYAGQGKQIFIKCYHEDNNSYYFSFSDNGIGIEEIHLNRIFERFYRVDKGRSRKAGGTGLGLSIVKNAVLFHKGEISAKRSFGGGTEFLFSISKTRQ